MTIKIFALHATRFCRQTRNICQRTPDKTGHVHKGQQEAQLKQGLADRTAP